MLWCHAPNGFRRLPSFVRPLALFIVAPSASQSPEEFFGRHHGSTEFSDHDPGSPVCEPYRLLHARPTRKRDAHGGDHRVPPATYVGDLARLCGDMETRAVLEERHAFLAARHQQGLRTQPASELLGALGQLALSIPRSRHPPEF